MHRSLFRGADGWAEHNIKLRFKEPAHHKNGIMILGILSMTDCTIKPCQMLCTDLHITYHNYTGPGHLLIHSLHGIGTVILREGYYTLPSVSLAVWLPICLLLCSLRSKLISVTWNFLPSRTCEIRNHNYDSDTWVVIRRSVSHKRERVSRNYR